MDDCKKQGVEVAAPSVNDSDLDFSVDKDGKIRFGMQAISGMGEAASAVIIAEREKNGPYKDIFDFLKRVDMHSVNKKNLEVLIKAGAFDGVGDMHRAQYFYKENQLETTPTYLDMIVKWAIRRQDGASSNQMSIFSMSEDLAEDEHPPIPTVEPWSNIERCKYEREVISTYLSGHPLDDYKYEIQMMANVTCEQLGNLEALIGREVRFAGMVSGAKEMVSGKGVPFGSMMIDDYSGSYEMKLYGDDYSDFKGFFTNNTFIFCRCKVTSRRYTDKTGNERNYISMKVLSMMNLAGVLDKYTSKLCFKIGINDINEEFCKAIEKLGKKHKGCVPLQATVVDPAQKLTLTMGATDLRVKVRDAIPELEQIKGVYEIKPQLKS
jgi:DNA polymerase-3 subunit alpha